MAVREVRLDLADATEIIEILGWIGEWFSQDNDNLAPSFSRFVGNDAYKLEHLRGDLDRFAFLLGDDGERLFGPEQQLPRGGVRERNLVVSLDRRPQSDT